MCYSEAESGIKGGIRCKSDKHAEKLRKDAVKAEQAFRDDPSDENEEERRQALLRWLSTPSGIRELERKGKTEEAERRRRGRERQLEQARAFRARKRNSTSSGLSSQEKIAMASDPATPVQVQMNLAGQKNPKVLMALAKNTTHGPVIQALAGSDDEKVYNIALRNPHSRQEDLKSVYEASTAQGNETRLRLIARHPNCPRDLYNELAQVAPGEIASKPDCPASLLAELATSKWRHARKGVAGNPNIDIRAQEILVSDSDANIRYTLVSNPSTDTSILHRVLVSDPDFHPRNKAQEVLSSR